MQPSHGTFTRLLIMSWQVGISNTTLSLCAHLLLIQHISQIKEPLHGDETPPTVLSLPQIGSLIFGGGQVCYRAIVTCPGTCSHPETYCAIMHTMW